MIFFDFDGTIVDVWERYFRVFCSAARCTEIRIDRYITEKQIWQKDDIVAERLHISLPDDYYPTKRRLLEDRAYLKMDRLLVPPRQLCSFFAEHDCRVLTMRRSRHLFLEQLQWLGLSDLAEKSIVLDPDEKMSKVSYLSGFASEPLCLIGDSESEFSATELEKVHVWLVATGLRLPESFPHKDNCTKISDVKEFINRFPSNT